MFAQNITTLREVLVSYTELSEPSGGWTIVLYDPDDTYVAYKFSRSRHYAGRVRL
jgi:hypothetical protein